MSRRAIHQRNLHPFHHANRLPVELETLPAFLHYAKSSLFVINSFGSAPDYKVKVKWFRGKQWRELLSTTKLRIQSKALLDPEWALQPEIQTFITWLNQQ